MIRYSSEQSGQHFCQPMLLRVSVVSSFSRSPCTCLPCSCASATPACVSRKMNLPPLLFHVSAKSKHESTLK